MKVFQILNGICHWDATPVHQNFSSTEGIYISDIIFVETPDYVHEGWGYDDTKQGDARFIRPEPPEPNEWIDEVTGKTYHWAYDEQSGTFYIADDTGAPIVPETLEGVIAALRDAQEALALLDIYPEEVPDNE